jgi:hypothetical protein
VAKKIKAPEQIEGSFVGIPHAVLDSVAFKKLSHIARSLLWDVVRQLNGRNNGRLHITRSWLRPRGWRSDDTVNKAKKELLEHGLIFETRKGGKNWGASQFAVTWLPISNGQGLDINVQQFPRGAWKNMDRDVQAGKNAGPAGGAGRSVERSSAVPKHGAEGGRAAPSHGVETGPLPGMPTPSDGQNVSHANLSAIWH